MRRRTVAIVGASLAAVGVAEQLRQRGDDSRVILLGDELTHPYDRPPLSKQVLLSPPGWQDDKVLLKATSWYEDNEVELKLGVRAVGFDGAGTLHLAGGGSVTADDVVVATGARPRTLPSRGDGEDVFYLRSLPDAMRLKMRLAEPGHLVVVGGGFVGLEVAAAARSRGWSVEVLERAEQLLGRVLPEAVGDFIARLMVERGIKVVLDSDVRQIHRYQCGGSVEMRDGTHRAADAIVVGIGTLPNTEWLDHAGGDGSGIRCDAYGRTRIPGLWAVGDAARWENLSTKGCRRVEQWTAARQQAAIVGDALVGRLEPWSDPPYFWSDLFDHKVQLVGSFSSGADVHLFSGNGSDVAVIGDSVVRGVMTLSAPRLLAQGSKLVRGQATMAEARAWAAAAMEVC